MKIYRQRYRGGDNSGLMCPFYRVEYVKLTWSKSVLVRKDYMDLGRGTPDLVDSVYVNNVINAIENKCIYEV